MKEKADLTDIIIIRKFYLTGQRFPNDIASYDFRTLLWELNVEKNLKISRTELLRRLENYTKMGIIEKASKSDEGEYLPIDGKENLVRAAIMKFFLIQGISKFCKLNPKDADEVEIYGQHGK